MVRNVKSADVIDENVETKRFIRGEIIGRFQPTGPNRWDDWELTRDDIGGSVEIPSGNRLFLEPLGAAEEIRFRWREGRGSVLRLKWLPTEEDLEALETGKWGVQEEEQATLIEKIFRLGPKNDPRDDMLEYFLDVLSSPYTPDPGIGWEAALVKKLRGQ